MGIQQIFPTSIYQSALQSARKTRAFNQQLIAEIEDIASLDVAGQQWSEANYKNGYTSYASANELQRASPTFGALEKAIDQHVKKFVRALDFNLGGRPLKMTTCWVNIMEANTHHSMHLHPLSVVSGTYYVQMPKNASCLKFEDPRLGLFMGAPPKKEMAKPKNRMFFEVQAQAGAVVLFESWLRHEVPMQMGDDPRISISFNYGWGD